MSIVPSHHRMLPDEYDDKPKQSNRSRSPTRIPRDRSEHGEPRKSACEFTIIFSLKINIRFVFVIFMFSCIVCSDFVSPRSSHVIILSAALKEEKPEGKDLLADLQDISDSERKTSTAESSMGNGWYKLEFEQKADMAHIQQKRSTGVVHLLYYCKWLNTARRPDFFGQTLSLQIKVRKRIITNVSHFSFELYQKV